MTRILIAESGAFRTLPDRLDANEVAGLDSEGRIVVDRFDARQTKKPGSFLFGLTLCCDASDKGIEDGVVCRACYSYRDTGSYLFLDPETGAFPDLDPVKEIRGA